MNRREAITHLGAVGLTAVGAHIYQGPAFSQKAFDPTVPPPFGSHPKHDMRNYAIPTQRQSIIILAYPGVSAMDLVAPQQIFSRMGNTDVSIVWKTKELITTDSDISIQPTGTLAEWDGEASLLFVPGGSNGVSDVMIDESVLSFLSKVAKKAAYVTSSGSGSLILAAAGLLTGYKATGHWMTRDMLKLMGAQPVNRRVVRDRNRITAAGNTAALDLAFNVASVMRNVNMANALQLANEYDPQPITHSGTPSLAPAPVTQMEWAMNAGLRDDIHESIAKLKNVRK